MSEQGEPAEPPDRQPPRAVGAGSRRQRRERRRQARRERWWGAGSLPLYVALAVLLFHGAWRAPATRSVGWGGDSQLFMWFLEWAPFSVATAHNPLLTDHINFPLGVNLMWNTAVLPLGLLLTPVTRIWGPVVSYNVALTAGVALSAWSAYFLVRRFVHRAPAAVVAGLVYGFSPFVTAHALGHLNWVSAFVPPFMALLVDELLVRQRRSAVGVGALLGAAAALQLMLSSELLAITALASVLLVVVLVLSAPRQVGPRAGHAVAGLAVGAVVFAVLAAFPLGTMLTGPNRPDGPLQRRDVFATDVANLVVPSPLLQFSPPAADDVTDDFTGNPAEMNGYVGVPLLVLLVVVTVACRRQAVVRVAAAMAVLLGVLSLGARLHVRGEVHHDVPLPFSLVERLPLLDHMLPNRFMVLVFLCLAVIVGVGLDRGVGRGGGVRIAAGAGVALALLALLPVVDFPTHEPLRSEFFRDRASVIPRDSVALVIPLSSASSGVEAMVWQADARMRFKMPGGYFAAPVNKAFGEPMPRTLALLLLLQAGHAAPPAGAPDYEQARRELRDWGVRTIVVGPMTNHQRAVDLVEAITGRSPRRITDSLIWSLG